MKNALTTLPFKSLPGKLIFILVWLLGAYSMRKKSNQVGSTICVYGLRGLNEANYVSGYKEILKSRQGELKMERSGVEWSPPYNVFSFFIGGLRIA